MNESAKIAQLKARIRALLPHLHRPLVGWKNSEDEGAPMLSEPVFGIPCYSGDVGGESEEGADMVTGWVHFEVGDRVGDARSVLVEITNVSTRGIAAKVLAVGKAFDQERLTGEYGTSEGFAAGETLIFGPDGGAILEPRGRPNFQLLVLGGGDKVFEHYGER